MIKKEIQERLDNLTKPKGSLGKLENIALKYGTFKNQKLPKLPNKKSVYVFAGDHGIAKEGVSAFPQEVTVQMVMNFLNGGAAINVFARHENSDLFIVDSGVNYDFEPHEKLLIKKVNYSTKNFYKEYAMTREEALKALDYGRDVAKHAIKNGVELAAIGDMGIGNTTTATAVAHAYGISMEDIIDIGTVINNEQLSHKQKVVETAIKNFGPFNDGIDILQKVGSYCFGEMAGFILECYENNIPVVIDGYPTSAGALIAYKINPEISKGLFVGHKSFVKGHQKILEIMGLTPILDLDMRLGEGTGAVLSFNLIEASIKMINEMATFSDAGVTKGEE